MIRTRLLPSALLLFLTLALGALGAETPTLFAEGERLFRENKPREASSLLEKAILEPGADERAWLYLALSYQQLGRFDEGLSVLRKGLAQARGYRHLYYYNMGNLFLLQGKAAFAEESYGEAINLESGYAPAYLNRANARMSLKEYQAAQADYSVYLALDQASSQRSAIEALLAKLGQALAVEERKAQEAESLRQAEEAAKQALIAEIAASLKAAAEETTSLSAGSGEVQGYGDELPLQD